MLQDLGLPPDDEGVGEGFATLREILQLAPFTKVIVVTGNAMASFYPEAAYADLFLVKPIALADLINFTKRLLSSKASTPA